MHLSFGVLGPMTGNSVLRRVEWDFRTRAAWRKVAFVGTVVAVYAFVIDVIDFLLACQWKRWGWIRLMANRRNVQFFVFGLCCLGSNFEFLKELKKAEVDFCLRQCRLALLSFAVCIKRAWSTNPSIRLDYSVFRPHQETWLSPYRSDRLEPCRFLSRHPVLQ